MDISRLLAPCSHLPLPAQPPSHEPIQFEESKKSVETKAKVVTNTVSLPSRHQQTSVISGKTPSKSRLPRTQPTDRKRGAECMNKTQTQAHFVPVKRKRKRRFSAQQKQVMRENQQDESQIYNLTLDVNELKQQVRDLLAYKCVFETRELAQTKVLEARELVVRQLFNDAVLRTTQRLFEIFRSGFREWEPEEDAFLAATIHKDVTITSGVRGADAFFDQWRRYTRLLEVRFKGASSTNILVSDTESCVVEYKGEFESRLTLAAIEVLFPHILGEEELLGKVVNRRLICSTRTLIYFDASGRIVQCDANVDFFGALGRILATNPMDVITLMANARISFEGSLIPDPDDADPAGLYAKKSLSNPASPVGSTSSDSLASASPPRSTYSSCSLMGCLMS